MAKEGSTVGGTMDAFGTAISMCLQYGVPSNTLIEKFTHSRFEPSGFTKNSEIPYAKSLVDYIFRWLALTFPDGKINALKSSPASASPEAATDAATPAAVQSKPAAATATEGERVDAQFKHFQEDAPVCDQCGAITVRNGSCYRCFVCGSSMGCS
jgi:ribonucleoside-diphosphate reductase alpha chain